MEQEFEVKVSEEFQFFAELQLALHEYAVNVKPGVKPEWFQNPELGLTVTSQAKVGLTLGVPVRTGLTREVVVSRAPATRDDPPEIYVSFYQNHNRARSSHSKLFEKYEGIMENRAVTVADENLPDLFRSLTEDIFQFLFTAEVPDIITY